MSERFDERRVTSRRLEQLFAGALGLLLVGYMFLGRGFAHIGVGPVYIGDAVLLIGIVVAVLTILRSRTLPPITWIIALLIAFAVLGAIRVLPYLGVHGMDALRDGVLWGYAGFALVIYTLADRRLVVQALRGYGWIVPVFAVWLPISWTLFTQMSSAIDPHRPGEVVPLVFFKAGDMAVHMVGSIAFLVLAASPAVSLRTVLWRSLILLPLLWTAFISGTANRGALVTFVVGLLAVAVLTQRPRNWLPIGVAIGLFAAGLAGQSLLLGSPSTAGQPADSSTIGATALPDRGLPAASDMSPFGEIVLVSTNGSSAPFSLPSDSQLQQGDGVGIANPGFELGSPGRGAVFAWTPRAAEVDLVEVGAHAGDQFASMGNPRDRYNATLRSNKFNFSERDDIAVSVWVKALEGRPGLEVYVDWFNRSGTRISSDFLASLRTRGWAMWQQCEGVLAAPAGTTQAQILFYESRGHATLGLDTVEVRSGAFSQEAPATLPQPRRPATLDQMVDNIVSIFGSSSDSGLEGTKQFRLEWWGTIVDYTVFGDYFWTGKGFGVNLADDDGFQSTADGSLRAPHNSHMTVLARMGVPGLVLWIALQAAFAAGLVRATIAHRRAGDLRMAVLASWILAYWFAMMVDTSFDPFIEGPQGGIWFWAVFGMGLVVMRRHLRRTPA